MERRQCIRILGGGVVAALSAGAAGLAALPTRMPDEAVEAWRGPAPQVAGDLRPRLLAYALLAPHAHNLQSWSVDLSVADEMTLYCDLQRLLPQTDPFSRMILMSHGSFLELLDMAAREHGHRADIALFPQGVFSPLALDARAVARIVLVPQPDVARDPLFAQVLKRHTNRAMYDPGRSVPAAALQALRAAAGREVAVGFVGADQPGLLAQHRRIANQAWRIELTTPRTVMESIRWLRVGSREIARHRDGISLLDRVPVAMDRLGLLNRQSPELGYALDLQLRDFEAKLASTPGFWWFSTARNDRAAQLAAGRAYVRAQLSATQLGLSFHPLSQALQEYPEQAQTGHDIHALTGAAAQGQRLQMWVRLGYAPATGPAPRRPLKAFVRA